VSAFEALFVPAELRDAVSGRAWLAAMLDVERALANAGATAGLVPAESAGAISKACDAGLFEWERLLEDGRASGNPVEPLVRGLRTAVGPEHERFVHLGATTQDVVDTAAMLVAGHALGLVLVDLDRVAFVSADLALAHRGTPMAARTLLQQAVPTTFGLVSAGWLLGVLDARRRLGDLREHGLAVQLGGAAGTLAALGDSGVRMLELVADELDLATPAAPWHTNRVRVAELGAALAIAAGTCGKIALDLVLLAQTEVGEVRVRGGGTSTAMPQKRNPVAAALARACAELAAADAHVLVISLQHEHQRAAGAWHAEWDALCGVLGHAGGAVAATAGALEGLEVDAARMRANLELGGGLVLAERVTVVLAERIGRGRAQELVAAAATGDSFREALLATPDLPLGADELDAVLDPAGYLGSSRALVDRALERYEAELG
jgi:3-carboxy-cis,cis-muconate cycloisomerase